MTIVTITIQILFHLRKYCEFSCAKVSVRNKCRHPNIRWFHTVFNDIPHLFDFYFAVAMPRNVFFDSGAIQADPFYGF